MRPQVSNFKQPFLRRVQVSYEVVSYEVVSYKKVYFKRAEKITKWKFSQCTHFTWRWLYVRPYACPPKPPCAIKRTGSHGWSNPRMSQGSKVGPETCRQGEEEFWWQFFRKVFVLVVGVASIIHSVLLLARRYVECRVKIINRRANYFKKIPKYPKKFQKVPNPLRPSKE